MKNPLKSYKFWIEAISAAILLAVGLVGIINKEFLVPLVVLITGIAILIFAVIRFIPLMKTLKTNRSRVLSFFELAVNLVVGVILFYGSILIFKDSNAESGFAYFAKKYYRFFLGGVLYLRGLCYFICTVLFKEETDQIKFWTHIAFITLGVVVCTVDSITPQILAFIVAIFALLGSAMLIVDAGFNYGKYRKAIKTKREKEKAKDNKAIAPGIEKPSEEDKNINIPVDEPDKHDETYVN